MTRVERNRTILLIVFLSMLAGGYTSAFAFGVFKLEAETWYHAAIGVIAWMVDIRYIQLVIRPRPLDTIQQREELVRKYGLGEEGQDGK